LELLEEDKSVIEESAKHYIFEALLFWAIIIALTLINYFCIETFHPIPEEWKAMII
jgi:hypothetical protein